MKTRITKLLIPLSCGWLIAWLLPGLWLKHPWALLDGSAPQIYKQGYVAFLYAVIVGSVIRAWHHNGPTRPQLGRPRLVELFYGASLAFLGLLWQRGILWLQGLWIPQCPTPELVISAVFCGLALAFGEEMLFRGYLFGVIREEKGRFWAYFSVNLVFALLHILRPGPVYLKAAIFVGTWLTSLLLCCLCESSGRLESAVGFHATLISAIVLSDATQIKAGWWAGLNGELAAGISGWLALVLTLIYIKRSQVLNWLKNIIAKQTHPSTPISQR